MAKNKDSVKKEKNKSSFCGFSKKGLMGLVMAGVMLVSPLTITGCSDGKDGKDGAPGTVWKSGTDCAQFVDAKEGDYFIDTDDYILYQKTSGNWSVVMENYGKPSNVASDIELRVASDNIQWRYKTGADTEWKNLIKVSTLTGKDGAPGTGWLTGTQITGTGLSISATVDGAKVGDLYFNSESTNIYECIAENTWKYLATLKMESGVPEVSNNVVDLVVFMGQSNMAGRGVASEAPVVQEGHGYEFRAVSDPTKLYNIVEPFGVNENRGEMSENMKTGSLVSAFVESYYSYTKVPIVGVSAAQGGKPIDWWATGGSPLNETITRYKAAQKYLNDNGYTIRHQYMVWLQGETDAGRGMSGETYKTKLIELFNQMKAQGIEKSMVIRIGDRQSNETLHDEIIKAQTELCAQSDDFVMISGKLAAIPLNQMKDDAHYKQYQYNFVGDDAGKNMAYYVNTGMEPYFYDAELGNYYPFGGSNDSTYVPSEPPAETVDSFIIDVSKSNQKYDLTALGTVSNGKLTIAKGTNTKGNYLEIEETVILSDDYSWTYEVVAGNFTNPGVNGAGMIANAGLDGYGFITIPPYSPSNVPNSSYAQFRFRDSTKSLQLDITLPSNYDPSKIHHFALVYDATTKEFKAYIDKVECEIIYTFGTKGGAFADTHLKNFLGGYPTSASSNFAGDFCYFAFTKDALSTSEMYNFTA